MISGGPRTKFCLLINYLQERSRNYLNICFREQIKHFFKDNAQQVIVEALLRVSLWEYNGTKQVPALLEPTVQ